MSMGREGVSERGRERNAKKEPTNKIAVGTGRGSETLDDLGMVLRI